MERRDFYRIEDRIHLIKTPIEKHLLSDDPYGEQYGIPRQALLINQLQSIDDESRDLMRQVADSNRALGTYLRSVNEKIDLVAKYIISHDEAISPRETVNLSEGGVSFYSGEPAIANTYLHLIMVLFPSYSSIAAIAEVKSCDKIDEMPQLYRVGTEFLVLKEADRKQIVRHIRRRQSQERRDSTRSRSNPKP